MHVIRQKLVLDRTLPPSQRSATHNGRDGLRAVPNFFPAIPPASDKL